MPEEHETNESSQDFVATFPARARAFYDISRARLDEQSRWVGTLDARLATTFSLSTVIVTLFTAAVVIGQDGLPQHLAAFSVVVLILFVASTFCGYRAFRASRWETRPSLRDVQARVRHPEARQWFLTATDMVAAYYANADSVREKEPWAKWAIRITALNAFVVSAAAVVAIVLTAGSR